MTGIDSLYRLEGGHVLIEMKLSSVAQLFNSFDPAPFHEKELDINAERYIVDAVNDFSWKTGFKIVIYLPDELMGTKDARVIPAAIESHFGYKSRMQRRKFRQRFVYGEFSLVVGLAFLAIATLASLAVDSYSSSFPAAHFLANALVITGWVAMWEPVTVFLFHLWPIVRQRKVYDKISRMEVDIRTYPKVPVPVPELLVKTPS
jgi:hypothetical protein